jgi:hypothetical protein
MQAKQSPDRANSGLDGSLAFAHELVYRRQITVPVVVRAPLRAGQALRVAPHTPARRAAAGRVERVPRVVAGAAPACVRRRLPLAFRTRDHGSSGSGRRVSWAIRPAVSDDVRRARCDSMPSSKMIAAESRISVPQVPRSITGSPTSSRTRPVGLDSGEVERSAILRRRDKAAGRAWPAGRPASIFCGSAKRPVSKP